MANSEAGWMDERPDEDGVYWYHQPGALPEALFVQHGFVYDFGDAEPTSIGFYEGRGKWLGPISPSDAEQLIELRKMISGGVGVIAQERARQVLEKGYTPEHDDEHEFGELGLAAALYALPYDAEMGGEPLISQADFINLHITLETGCDFYLNPETDKLRRLAKAGALIAAEIDRLQRLNPKQPGKET